MRQVVDLGWMLDWVVSWMPFLDLSDTAGSASTGTYGSTVQLAFYVLGTEPTRTSTLASTNAAPLCDVRKASATVPLLNASTVTIYLRDLPCRE